jgi:hypothetical protein
LAANPTLERVTVPLEYKETSNRIISRGVSLVLQTDRFKGEPAEEGDKTYRGMLNFEGPAAGSLAFVWQKGAGKLFLDLNRNLDFADDPNGVFTSNTKEHSYYQSFAGVRLPVVASLGEERILTDVVFWDYRSRPSVDLALRSFWQGRVVLHGQEWELGLVGDALNQVGSRGRSQLLVRPWEKRDQSFSADGQLPDTVPFAQKQFFGGHAYHLAVATNLPDGAPGRALQITEQTVALGELRIAGQYIQRLVLDSAGDSYTVQLIQPAGVVNIPAGSYNLSALRLENQGATACWKAGAKLPKLHLVVDGQKPGALDMGGPLTNSIAVSRRGQNLRLDYRLVGAGGADFQMVNQDRSHPPEFAVFKGTKQVASGKFEFG